ncbi:MAG TPA: choice-of-anchor D domain-containing protein [Pontiella sp.]
MMSLKNIPVYLLSALLLGTTATYAAQEVDVTGNGQSIPDGDVSPVLADDTDFGSVNVGSSLDHVFTIVNTGDKNLSLDAFPNVVSFEGGSSSDFTVFIQPDGSQVSRNGGTRTFTIRFTPTGSGLKTARITFGNSDADENPYDFSIQGTAVAPAANSPTLANPPTAANIQDTTATLGGEVSDTGGASITERGVWWSTQTGFSTPASGTIYESEDATLSGAVVANNQAGYTGSGFADYGAIGSGDYVEWSVNAPVAGNYCISFRYALGSGDRPLEIRVNGGVVDSSLSFPATGAWTTWLYTTKLSVFLNAGANTIRATENGFAGGNVDHLLVESALKVSTTGTWGIGSFSESVIDLPESSLIYFKSFAVNSEGTTYSSELGFQTEPSSQASGISFSNVGTTNMTINWSANGSGDGVIVVVNEAAPVDADPTDGTEHTAAPAYSLGENIGGGNFVVYRGTGSSVDMTNLDPFTTYYVAIYAYAGSGTGLSGINYLQNTPVTNSQITLQGTSAPTVENPLQTLIEDTTATLGGEVTATNNATVIERGIYWSTNDLFTPPLQGTKVSSSGSWGTGTFTENVTGLPESDLVYYRAFAENSAGTNYTIQASFQTEPTTQATGVTFSGVGANQMQINWSGNGSGDGVIVVIKQGSAVDTGPTDGTEHNANNLFGSGAELGTGNYVAFRGSGSSVVVTNLLSDVTYHVAVYAYSGAGTGVMGINYQQDAPATGNQKTLLVTAPPSVANPSATSIQDTTATLGGEITSINNATVTERGIYWSTTAGFSPPSLGTKVSETGSFGAGSFTRNVTDLPENDIVYFKAFAVNSEGTNYTAQSAFQTEPTIQASGVTITDVTAYGMQVNWSDNGSGNGVIVVVKQNTAVDADPVDGVEHSANAQFGNGAHLGGGNYVVYRGSGASIAVTNLASESDYHVAVYAYSGAGTGIAGINYQQDAPPTSSATTAVATLPSTPPSIINIVPTAVEHTTATLGGDVTFINGANITERGIYWSTTDGFTPPSQGTKVSSIGEWGAGAFSENVTGLNQGSLIYYRAFAVNSAGTSYTTQSSFQMEPETQASSPSFSSILDTSAVLSWTPGSGEGTLVVMKIGGPTSREPVDGTEHVADPGFQNGESLNAGNYITYRSSGSSVTITNLWPNSIYYVSLFEYSGTGSGLSGINYQQDAPPSTSVQTLIGQTWMGHNDKYGVSDCLTCHGAGHNGFNIPRNAEQQSTTCGQCHNPTGVASNKCNIALHINSSSNVLADCGSCHEVHGGADLSELITTRASVTGTNLSYFRVDTNYIPQAIDAGVYHNPLDYAFGSAPYNGACQVCHTNTVRYRNFDLEYTGHAAPGSDCQSCHAHEDNWQGLGGTDCTVCHATVKGTHRAVMPDFGLIAGHIPGGSVTTNDCMTCHHEAYGNAYHGNTTTDLRNVDDDSVVSIAQPFSRNTNTDVLEADVVNLQNNFCLKCHDADGANGDTTPFSTGNPVLDINSAMNPANSYFHPVLGPGNNATCNSSTMHPPWNQSNDHDMISCFDCHGINAHGSSNNDMLRVHINGLTDGANIRAFCTTCHVFGTGFSAHSQTNHRYESGNSYECRGCHAGLVDDNGQPVSNLAAVPKLEIHGGNFVWPANANLGAGTTTQHFMNGAWLSGWEPNTCSVISPCKNHGASKGY